MSLAAFLARFPEFAGDRAPADMITAVLAEVAAQVSAEVFGDLRTAAIGLLTAHRISVSPWGQQARLVASGDKTTYLVEYEAIRAAVAGGALVRAL